MKNYVGIKNIQARPMTRGEYNAYRGWAVPPDEDGADAGYLVEYLDGGKANDSRHVGYISWSPVDVFERAYHEVTPAPVYTETTTYDPDYSAHVVIRLDGIELAFVDGEPEDNNMSRNFDDVFSISELVKHANELGLAGKKIEFVFKEGDE